MDTTLGKTETSLNQFSRTITIGPLYSQVSQLQIQQTSEQKYLGKNSRMFQGNFNLASADNYLHSKLYMLCICMYMVYATVYTAFTLCSVQFSPSVLSDSLWPHGLQHARPPCPSPTPRVYPNPCPMSRWCHPAISSSVVPFYSCPQSFPASGSFQTSQFFTSAGQSIRVSASTSVLPMNT